METTTWVDKAGRQTDTRPTNQRTEQLASRPSVQASGQVTHSRTPPYLGSTMRYIVLRIVVRSPMDFPLPGQRRRIASGSTPKTLLKCDAGSEVGLTSIVKRTIGRLGAPTGTSGGTPPLAVPPPPVPKMSSRKVADSRFCYSTYY